MISVIVPVYNVEKYIEHCIDSILNQTFSDFELILVNDGSVDCSGEICDRFAQNDKRILVIHKENGGQNSAIKAGLKKATGEYVCFVDSDDWLEENALEVLYDCIQSNGADLSVSNAFRNGATESDFMLHFCEEGIYDKQKIEEEIFPNLITRINQKYVSISPSRCGKLFRKDLIFKVLDYCDESIRRGEDKLLTYPYIMICSKIVITKAKTYHYRDNAASISNSYRADRMEEQKKLIWLLGEISRELTDFDFSRQLEAMTLEAVNMTISELGKQIHKNDRKKIYTNFKSAVKDDIVSRRVHPFARHTTEHIKFHLIMNRRVMALWLYYKFLAFISDKK